MADPGEGPGEPAPAPLVLEQTDAQRAEKNILGDRLPLPYLKVWIRHCNPDRVTLTEKGNILEKNQLPISLFTYY